VERKQESDLKNSQYGYLKDKLSLKLKESALTKHIISRREHWAWDARYNLDNWEMSVPYGLSEDSREEMRQKSETRRIESIKKADRLDIEVKDLKEQRECLLKEFILNTGVDLTLSDAESLLE